VWFFLIFTFSFLCIYCMLYILICSAGTYSRYEILNPRVEDMIYIYIYLFGNFLIILEVTLFSLHTPLHMMSEALYSGLWSLEIEEWCSKTGQMYVLTRCAKTPARVCSLYFHVHKDCHYCLIWMCGKGGHSSYL